MAKYEQSELEKEEVEADGVAIKTKAKNFIVVYNPIVLDQGPLRLRVDDFYSRG